MSALWPVVWAVTPTIILGILFWYVMRIILHADRNERSTYQQIEAEERAKFAAEHGANEPATTPSNIETDDTESVRHRK